MSSCYREANLNETFDLKIICMNIANSVRDVGEYLLGKRIDRIINVMLELKPDVLILLEAGRPSGPSCFTSFAVQIEVGTDLRYEGTKRVNADTMCFGKALFINPNRVVVRNFTQLWTSDTPERWSGARFGNDVLLVELFPVVPEGNINRIIIDRPFRVCASHFPMGDTDRMNVATWLCKNSHLFDIVMGDMNTFPTSLGPELVEMLEGTFINGLQGENLWTFKSFPQDVVEIPNEKLHLLHPDSIILERGETTSKTLPQGWLDHFFITPDETTTGQGNSKGEKKRTTFAYKGEVGPFTDASDHAPIIAYITL